MENLKEKVGQLFICKTPDNIDQIEMFIKEGIGGFMIGKGGEIVSESQSTLEGDSSESLKRFVKLLNRLSQKNKKIPLFLAIDGEGGKYFNRLKSISDYKSPRFYGKKFEKDGNLEFFKKEVEKFAKLMKQIGFNMNFAPLVDCAKKGYKGYVAEERVLIKNKDDLTKSEAIAACRSYSDKMETVITLGLTAMRIFQEQNIIPTLKHFPSYGILKKNQNPHRILLKLAILRNKILAQIEPYKKAFKNGCYAIMKGHIITCLDWNVPTSLSVKIDKFLKNELSFNGLVIVDELHMGAIRQYYRLDHKEVPKRAAVDALKVNDIILTSHPEDFIVMRDAIIKEANKNEKFLERVDEAYKKILYYKKIINLL